MDKLKICKRLLSKKTGEVNVLKCMLEEMEAALEMKPTKVYLTEAWLETLCKDTRESLKINQDLHEDA